MGRCMMPVEELYAYRKTLVDGLGLSEVAYPAPATEIMYLDELMAWHACGCDSCRAYMRQVRIDASVKRPPVRVVA